MANVILAGVIACILLAAIAYIHKEKKRGVRCIGCPAAETCGSHCGGHSEDGCGCHAE